MVDPCGSCGRGRCSNLDDMCLGSGVLKTTLGSCNLRWARVPDGIEVTFNNLWGDWSSTTADCTPAYTCYEWWEPICRSGSEPKETWIGPVASNLGDARCAVSINIRPGFTCDMCPPDSYRKDATGVASCMPCSSSPCPSGQYRGQCGHSSDSSCMPCSVFLCPSGQYRGQCSHSSDSICMPCSVFPCPSGQ